MTRSWTRVAGVLIVGTSLLCATGCAEQASIAPTTLPKTPATFKPNPISGKDRRLAKTSGISQAPVPPAAH